jgi:hypothetical protein
LFFDPVGVEEKATQYDDKIGNRPTEIVAIVEMERNCNSSANLAESGGSASSNQGHTY